MKRLLRLLGVALLATTSAACVVSETRPVEYTPAERANTVTTIRAPEAVGGEAIRRYCRDHFEVSLGGGLGRLSETTFRIGHMGYLNPPMILGTLGALEASLKALNVPCGDGGLAAVTDWLAASAPSPD